MESQLHRELASGLSAPVGFKNNTAGNVLIAIDAMEAAKHPHVFLGIGDDGHIARVTTRGNPWTHIVLRGGGRNMTNYDPGHVMATADMLNKRGLSSAIMVDCSHGNSGKDYAKQDGVFLDVFKQYKSGRSSVVGAMLESNLREGSQKIPADPRDLKHGVSVTDGCMSWDATEALILKAFSIF